MARRTRRVGVSGAVQDTVPTGGGSLQTRLKRAREATDRAQSAEHDALAEATEAKQLADEVKATADDGRRRLRKAKSETAEQVKQRVAEARRRADEKVEEERAKAEAEVGATVRKVDEARRHAGATTDREAEAQTVQREAAGNAADVANQLRTPEVDGDVKSMTKSELMDLAVALGVEGRKQMNKQQRSRPSTGSPGRLAGRTRERHHEAAAEEERLGQGEGTVVARGPGRGVVRSGLLAVVQQWA